MSIGTEKHVTLHSLKPEDILCQVVDRCISCGDCLESCQFLKTYGAPGEIAKSFNPSNKQDMVMPFECSLCGLCASVCPEAVDPRSMFLQMRRETYARGEGRFPEHSGLTGYERKGTSKRFTWYGLPPGCDTVFFPGCTLPGTRPVQTKALFEKLRDIAPDMGIVLDCCTKPSHDFGRQQHFLTMFGEMKQYLQANGIRRVLVACPNCHKVFREYAPEFLTSTVYEALAGQVHPPTRDFSCSVTVHDPCALRNEPEVQNAVRALAAEAGCRVEEMPHSRATAICCGEGGNVAALAPDFAAAWADMRVSEAAGRRMITCCAGCSSILGTRTPTIHILDIVLDPESALSGKAPVSRAPITYLNRLRLKRHFRNTVKAAVSRERTFTPVAKTGRSFRPLIIPALLVAAIIMIHMTGLSRYLTQDQLRRIISGYGALAPAVYILVYTLAPVFFLPGLPITIVGGILFGPVWGVAYTITGATAGACLAFLVSRHAARGWIESRLAGSRWRKLDQEVEKHGWKVVAFTRLIPVFPFNLLNYAFGLTKIRFLDYAVATFICMLPACIAFIVFSSSLLDLLRGRVSGTFLLGAAMIVLVSTIPIWYRRRSHRAISGATRNGAE